MYVNLSIKRGECLSRIKLYAKGGEEGPEYRRAHRLVGAWEYAKLARQAAELGHYVIGVGFFIARKIHV